MRIYLILFSLLFFISSSYASKVTLPVEGVTLLDSEDVAFVARFTPLLEQALNVETGKEEELKNSLVGALVHEIIPAVDLLLKNSNAKRLTTAACQRGILKSAVASELLQTCTIKLEKGMEGSRLATSCISLAYPGEMVSVNVLLNSAMYNLSEIADMTATLLRNYMLNLLEDRSVAYFLEKGYDIYNFMLVKEYFKEFKRGGTLVEIITEMDARIQTTNQCYLNRYFGKENPIFRSYTTGGEIKILLNLPVLNELIASETEESMKLRAMRWSEQTWLASRLYQTDKLEGLKDLGMGHYNTSIVSARYLSLKLADTPTTRGIDALARLLLGIEEEPAEETKKHNPETVRADDESKRKLIESFERIKALEAEKRNLEKRLTESSQKIARQRAALKSAHDSDQSKLQLISTLKEKDKASKQQVVVLEAKVGQLTTVVDAAREAAEKQRIEQAIELKELQKLRRRFEQKCADNKALQDQKSELEKQVTTLAEAREKYEKVQQEIAIAMTKMQQDHSSTSLFIKDVQESIAVLQKDNDERKARIIELEEQVAHHSSIYAQMREDLIQHFEKQREALRQEYKATVDGIFEGAYLNGYDRGYADAAARMQPPQVNIYNVVGDGQQQYKNRAGKPKNRDRPGSSGNNKKE